MSSKPFIYGKYVILDRIAVGGMAEVFRAKTYGVHGFQRLLVIKRHPSSPVQRRRIRRYVYR